MSEFLKSLKLLGLNLGHGSRIKKRLLQQFPRRTNSGSIYRMKCPLLHLFRGEQDARTKKLINSGCGTIGTALHIH